MQAHGGTLRPDMTKISEIEEELARLYSLLDDISTAGDALKPPHSPYFTAVEKRVQQRGLGGISTDGYNLMYRGKIIKHYKPEQPVKCPWRHPSLIDWSIVGMNHYNMNGKKFLFVSMSRGSSVIKAEGNDEEVWDSLVIQASRWVNPALSPADR